MKDFFNIVKALFQKPKLRGRRISLARILYAEFAIGTIVLALFLILDFWLYQSTGSYKQDSLSDKAENIVLFDQKEASRAADAHKKHDDFLRNPIFPPISNPF